MSNKPLDLTKPVQTRDGRSVRIIETNFKGYSDTLTIVAIVWDSTVNQEVIHLYTPDGKTNNNSKWDLINIPEKHTRWINIFPTGHNSENYKTKEEADRIYNGVNISKRIACIKIEFEEGEGLN